MKENFLVEIISPDSSVFKSETTEVTIPSFEGQMGILKNHVPLITFLRPGVITVKQDKGEEKFFTEEGIVEFVENNLLILSSTARTFDNLKKENIENIIKSTQELLDKDDINDKEKYLLSYKIDTLKEIN